ncbi:hypothetical protein R6Q57_009101 [Mikania cordata]
MVSELECSFRHRAISSTFRVFIRVSTVRLQGLVCSTTKSDDAYEFPTKTFLLTVDPIVSVVSNVSEVCAEKSRVSGSEEKEGEKSAGRSTNYSTFTSQLSFVPKTDFVEKFDEIKIRPNDMLKGFEKTCAINRASKLTSSHLTKQAAPAYSTATKEAGS